MIIPVTADPDFLPGTWSLGYQSRQFGLAGDNVSDAASVLSGLATPPQAMVTAAESVPSQEYFIGEVNVINDEQT